MPCGHMGRPQARPSPHWRETQSPPRSIPLTSSSCIRVQPNSSKRRSTPHHQPRHLYPVTARAWPKSDGGSVNYERIEGSSD
jgi:hypothetical protein